MPPPNENAFRERLHALRTRAGFRTQADLAAATGGQIGQSTISDYETGKSFPSSSLLGLLCDALARALREHVSADYMIGRSDAISGLAPDQWIVDKDAVALARRNPKAHAVIACMAKVPRNHRVLDHQQAAELQRELDTRTE